MIEKVFHHDGREGIVTDGNRFYNGRTHVLVDFDGTVENVPRYMLVTAEERNPLHRYPPALRP